MSNELASQTASQAEHLVALAEKLRDAAADMRCPLSGDFGDKLADAEQLMEQVRDAIEEVKNLPEEVRDAADELGFDLSREDDRMLAGWNRHDYDLPNHAASGASKRRMTECVWTNY
jgi:hypothetical protein